jgi:hypothetical protein
MGKHVMRVTTVKREAMSLKKRLNASFRERGINREAYVGKISKAYVQERTIKGYPVRNKNYAVYVRNKR